MRLENATSFVEIEIDGMSVVKREGRLATRGELETTRFVDDESTLRHFEAEQIAALRGGFERIPGEPPDARAMAIRDPVLEQAVRDHRDDRDARLILADWMQASGNPMGEMIALGVAAPTPRTEKRLAALHNGLALPMADRVRFRWKLGMWRSIRIENQYEKDPRTGAADLDPLPVVKSLFAHPLCAALEELVLGGLHIHRNEKYVRQILEAAARHAWAKDLVRLEVGDCRAAHPPRYMERYNAGALGTLVSTELPNLRELAVWRSWTQRSHHQTTTLKDGLSHAALRSLTIGGRLDGYEVPVELDAIHTPALERLVLWLGAGYNSTRGVELASVFSLAKFPELRHLGLCNCDDTDVFIPIVAKAAIAKKLVTLDLTAGSLSTLGAQLLIAAKSAFPRLRELIVDENRLDALAIRDLQATFPKVSALEQHTWPGRRHR